MAGLRQPKQYKLRVFTYGKGDPVVLLHGQLSTHNFYEDLIKLVQHDRRIYAVDLLGFGDSPRPRNCEYTIEDHVAALHATLSDLPHSNSFDVVGHSMGAQLALAYTRQYPDRVNKLVLTSMPLLESDTDASEQLALLDPEHSWLMGGVRARFVRLFPRVVEKAALSMLAIRMEPGRQRELAVDGMRHSWRGFSKSLQNVVVGFDPYTTIPQVPHRIHFIFGNQDPIATNPKQKLRHIVSQRHKIEIVDGSHHLPAESPDAVAKRILSL